VTHEFFGVDAVVAKAGQALHIAPSQRDRFGRGIRREGVDHIVVLGEAHLCRILNLTPVTTTEPERIGLWTRMRRSLAWCSAPVSFVHARFSMDFITTIVGHKVFGTHSGRGRLFTCFMIGSTVPAKRSASALPAARYAHQVFS
jgi:hypothetical protein